VSHDPLQAGAAAARLARGLTSLAGVLATAGLLLAVLRPLQSPYLRLLQHGAERAARGEWIAALGNYRAAAEMRPDDPDPHLRSASVYLAWGRVALAQGELAEAQRRGASQAAVDRLRLDVLAAQQDWTALEGCAQRLLRVDPQSRTAHHALARAYEGQGRWPAARAEYEALLAKDPTDVVANERLGLLILGDDPTALARLASADGALAQRVLDALRASDANQTPTYVWLVAGRTLLEAQEWALAARQFERAWQQEPGLAETRAYYGYALGRAGRASDGLEHLQAAVAADPSSALAHALLGLHYDRAGNPEAARLEFEAAYDLDPRNAALCTEIGEAWLAEHRYLAAEIWLREATVLEPENPEPWLRLAAFYLEHSLDVEKGTLSAGEALSLAPDDARAHDLVGWAAFLRGDYGLARASLERAVELDPELPEAHYHLGRLWNALGSAQQADAAYIRALELDADGSLEPLIRRAVGARWGDITQGVLSP
jgi:tetratricopeptide (TPR) repeat protein